MRQEKPFATTNGVHTHYAGLVTTPGRPGMLTASGQLQETQVEKLSLFPPVSSSPANGPEIPDHGPMATTCSTELELSPSYPYSFLCQALHQEFSSTYKDSMAGMARLATQNLRKSIAFLKTWASDPAGLSQEGAKTPKGGRTQLIIPCIYTTLSCLASSKGGGENFAGRKNRQIRCQPSIFSRFSSGCSDK